MSDSEVDIYGDLPEFNYDDNLHELQATIDELLARNDELFASMAQTKAEKEKTEENYNLLKRNMSSFILTAQKEVARKDKIISDLRKQLSELENAKCNKSSRISSHERNGRQYSSSAEGERRKYGRRSTDLTRRPEPDENNIPDQISNKEVISAVNKRNGYLSHSKTYNDDNRNLSLTENGLKKNNSIPHLVKNDKNVQSHMTIFSERMRRRIEVEKEKEKEESKIEAEAKITEKEASKVVISKKMTPEVTKDKATSNSRKASEEKDAQEILKLPKIPNVKDLPQTTIVNSPKKLAEVIVVPAKKMMKNDIKSRKASEEKDAKEISTLPKVLAAKDSPQTSCVHNAPKKVSEVVIVPAKKLTKNDIKSRKASEEKVAKDISMLPKILTANDSPQTTSVHNADVIPVPAKNTTNLPITSEKEASTTTAPKNLRSHTLNVKGTPSPFRITRKRSSAYTPISRNWNVKNGTNKVPTPPAKKLKKDLSPTDLFGSDCSISDDDDDVPSIKLPPAVYEDSCSAQIDNSRFGKTDAIINEEKRPFQTVNLEKPKSIFSPQKSNTTTNLFSAKQNLKIIEDSFIGQFETTTQFVSALTKTESKLSPLRCSKSNEDVSQILAAKAQSLFHQITDEVEKVNVLIPRKYPRVYSKVENKPNKTFSLKETFLFEQEEKVKNLNTENDKIILVSPRKRITNNSNDKIDKTNKTFSIKETFLFEQEEKVKNLNTENDNIILVSPQKIITNNNDNNDTTVENAIDKTNKTFSVKETFLFEQEEKLKNLNTENDNIILVSPQKIITNNDKTVENAIDKTNKTFSVKETFLFEQEEKLKNLNTENDKMILVSSQKIITNNNDNDDKIDWVLQPLEPEPRTTVRRQSLNIDGGTNSKNDIPNLLSNRPIENSHLNTTNGTRNNEKSTQNLISKLESQTSYLNQEIEHAIQNCKISSANRKKEDSICNLNLRITSQPLRNRRSSYERVSATQPTDFTKVQNFTPIVKVIKKRRKATLVNVDNPGKFSVTRHRPINFSNTD